MTRREIFDEADLYLLKIVVIEDWFRLLCTKKRIPDRETLRDTLNQIRPEVPTRDRLKSYSARKLLEVINPLSVYAFELEGIWLAYHARRLPPSGFDRGYMCWIMGEIERGGPLVSRRPFTRGMKNLFKLIDQPAEIITQASEGNPILTS